MSQRGSEIELFVGLGENESMPAVGNTFEFVSGITNITYDVTIKKIKSIRWAPDNDGIIATVVATKEPKKVFASSGEDEEEAIDEV